MKTRIIWDKLLKEIDTDEIIVITGPRQVGKTTTVNWLLQNIPSQNKLYLDMQNIADRELFEVKNFNLIVNALQKKGLNIKEKMYLAIDEIQLLEHLPDAVKFLYDHYSIKFFLTGSSSFYIKNRFTESMAGRKLIYEMFPLRFQEFLNFKGVSYDLPEKLDITNKFDKYTYNQLSHLYLEYIEYGGMPKIVLTDDIERKKLLLDEIFSSYITLDVEVLSDFKSSTDFRKVVKLLASRIGNKLNVNEISKVTGLSRQTVDSYISFLEKTYLIRKLDGYSGSADIRTRIPPKIYFVDTGIANINAELSSGAKYENAVCNQLSFYGNLSYFTTRYIEIDFIINGKIAIEVKETPTDKDLSKLMERSNSIQIDNFVLVGKEESAKFDKYLWGGCIR